MEQRCNRGGYRGSSDRGSRLNRRDLQKCFGRECELRQIPYVRELRVELEYKGFVFEEPLRLDFLIDDVLILEFKAVQEILPIHEAQLMSYMKLLKRPLGLLFNFHEVVLKNGIRRVVLKEAL